MSAGQHIPNAADDLNIRIRPAVTVGPWRALWDWLLAPEQLPRKTANGEQEESNADVDPAVSQERSSTTEMDRSRTVHHD